ncbi:MAG: Gfo/Idh/MocA family oxidoreductase [Acidimicrobiales bacterium]|nr:Gfo/Idh/MocA family oxidoreductase [Acidimicrobiales bacterium]
MADIGVALLGLGRAGSFHLASIGVIDGIVLRQVFDTDADRAADVAAATGATTALSGAAAVAASDVDAVVVASPTLTHHDHVIAALAAGKPVLSEKPLGTTLADIDACFDGAAAAQVPLLVAFQRRFDPSFAAVARAAHAGEAGELQFIRSVSRDNPVPSLDYIATSCGIFHDCVVHDFDMVCHVAQSAPVEVHAFASSFIAGIGALGDVDNVAVSLRFESGLLATIDVNRSSAYGYDQRLEVFGSDGMLQVENRPLAAAPCSDDHGLLQPRIDWSFPTRYADAYRLEFVHFIDCVRGDAVPEIGADDVRRSHLVANAAEASLESGVVVALDA